MTRLLPLLFALSVLWSGPALPLQPDERLDDPVLEERARDLSKELRCLVCQNENIDASNAPLARDLRLIVRERLEAGDSDAEVLDFVVARYGEFVLMRPRFKAETLLLWLSPALLLVLGLALAWPFVRRQRRAAPAAAEPLSEEEEAALKRLLNDDPPRH